MVSIGNHKATLVSAALAEVGVKGTPGFRVVFSTGEGEVEWMGYLTPAAKKKTLETMKLGLGWNGKALSLPDFGIKEVVVVVEQETNPNSGKTYARVKWINYGVGQQREALPVTRQKELWAALEIDATYHSIPVDHKTGSDFAADDNIPF